MITVGLLLAAGRSQRFGLADKLLAPFKNRPLVTHAAEAMLGIALDHRLAVVRDRRVAAQLDGFEMLFQLEAGAPQSANLALGARRAVQLNADRLLIVLGDMPLVGAALLQEVLNLGTDDEPAAATDGTVICPPACFPARCLSDLVAMEGDKGAARIIGKLPNNRLIVAPAALLIDIDRPGDL